MGRSLSRKSVPVILPQIETTAFKEDKAVVLFSFFSIFMR